MRETRLSKTFINFEYLPMDRAHLKPLDVDALVTKAQVGPNDTLTYLVECWLDGTCKEFWVFGTDLCPLT